jgi:hypothetical protein
MSSVDVFFGTVHSAQGRMVHGQGPDGPRPSAGLGFSA